MPRIRGEDENINANQKDKMEVWKENEGKMLNEENDWSGELDFEKNEVPCENSFCKSSSVVGWW